MEGGIWQREENDWHTYMCIISGGENNPGTTNSTLMEGEVVKSPFNSMYKKAQ